MSDAEDAKAQPRRRRARRNFNSDSDSESVPEGKFRFNAKKVFLTYPHCPVREQGFLEAFNLRDRVKTCFAKHETHADGSPHLHVYIAFSSKLDLSDPRCFDLITYHPVEGQVAPAALERYHPNIKRINGPEDTVKLYEYLCKDGNTPSELRGQVDLYRFSKNFCISYRDRESWLAYRFSTAQQPPTYPIFGPDGTGYPDPASAGKKRNLWIYGPANAGKTQWLEEKIYRFQNYKVGDTRYPFDNYARQQIIVYDDIKPTASHLLVLGNTSSYARPVPGPTRYHQRYIPGGVALWTIVCINTDISTTYAEEEEPVITAIKARFIEVPLNLVVID